ncbi:MAG: hypothetical protein KME49_32765 [Brasilonema octagenarum HA4186-MV1]|nr:hypothetical protein [Brasilonema octagenarum HA4186-MV1]
MSDGVHTSHIIIQKSGKTSPCPIGHPSRQVLQRSKLAGGSFPRQTLGEPQRQMPATGNPSSALAPQRTGSPYQGEGKIFASLKAKVDDIDGESVTSSNYRGKDFCVIKSKGGEV